LGQAHVFAKQGCEPLAAKAVPPAQAIDSQHCRPQQRRARAGVPLGQAHVFAKQGCEPLAAKAEQSTAPLLAHNVAPEPVATVGVPLGLHRLTKILLGCHWSP
jgi:hypothetical protein